MECTWVFPEFLDALSVKAAEYIVIDPDTYAEVIRIIGIIEKKINEKNITFCHYAFTLEGVLINQSDYYLGTYNEIRKGVNVKAEEIVDAITLRAN